MDTVGGLLAGLYFAYANIKGKPLYKFFELKYVQADTNISYHEDTAENDEQLAKAIAENKALKLEQKNIKYKHKMDRKLYKALHKKEQAKIKHQLKISQDQQKLDSSKHTTSKVDELNTTDKD